MGIYRICCFWSHSCSVVFSKTEYLVQKKGTTEKIVPFLHHYITTKSAKIQVWQCFLSGAIISSQNRKRNRLFSKQNKILSFLLSVSITGRDTYESGLDDFIAETESVGQIN